MQTNPCSTTNDVNDYTFTGDRFTMMFEKYLKVNYETI